MTVPTVTLILVTSSKYCYNNIQSLMVLTILISLEDCMLRKKILQAAVTHSNMTRFPQCYLLPKKCKYNDKIGKATLWNKTMQDNR